jgi:tetratricopeptide (TPR) repeat protein
MHQPEPDERPEIRALLLAFEARMATGQPLQFTEPEFGLLASYFEDEGQLDLALELLDLALELYPFQLDIFLHKAELLIRREEPQKALDLLQKALFIAPNELDIFLLRAEALAAMHRFEDAMAELERVLPDVEGPADQSDIFYLKSLVLEKMGDYDEMFATLQKTIHLDPGHIQALEHFGVVVEIMHRYEESIAFHSALLEENPYLSIAWFNLGLAQAYEGLYDDALDSLEYAFLTDPKFEHAYWEFIDVCFEVQDYTRAMAVLEDMQEHFPPDGESLTRMGQCLFMAEDYAQARRTLRRALSIDPAQDEAMFYLGKCYAIEENWTKAMSCFSRAIHINAEQESYHAAKGAIHAIMGNETAAEYSMRQAIDLAPDEPIYWLHFAAYLLERNQAERGWNLLCEAAQYTAEPDIEYGKAACLFALGKPEEAFPILEYALEADFSAHTIFFLLMPELKSDPRIQALISLSSGEPTE